MTQGPDGAWAAREAGSPGAQRGIVATGPSREWCLEAFRRALAGTLLPGGASESRLPGEPVTLIVELVPQFAGVAEAAMIMGWDKRRVITYLDRGRFPEPRQTLASGRLWLRSDVEEFAATWWARYRTRRKSLAQPADRPPGGAEP